jgi:hypothetical protein
MRGRLVIINLMRGRLVISKDMGGRLDICRYFYCGLKPLLARRRGPKNCVGTVKVRLATLPTRLS